VPDHADTEDQKQIIRDKCTKFNKWCEDVGIKCPKITYPEFFEGGLVGGMVNAPIAHREAFLIVPYSVIISLDKCNRDPVMGLFYAENP
jgi:hypothetical protein